MVAPHDHVVYVTVPGGKAARSSSNRMTSVAAGMAGGILLCMALVASRDALASRTQTTSSSLAQALTQTDLAALQSKLAGEELAVRVARDVAGGLPAPARALALRLSGEVAGEKLAVDCSQKASYLLIQSSFKTMASNITAENKTLYEQDATLASAAAEAKAKWLAAEASYREASSSQVSAQAAADYARGQYQVWSAAHKTAQASHDTDVPKLSAEKTQLNSEKPVLNELLVLIKSLSSAAKSSQGVTPLLSQIRAKAEAIGGGGGGKVAAQVLSLKTAILASDGAAGVEAMSGTVSKLLEGIATRVGEIDVQVSKLAGEVSSTKTKLSEWEEKMVLLGSAQDKAVNAMNSANLVRQDLAGVHKVRQQTYDDHHATFEDDVASLARSAAAVATINTKVDAVVASCA